MRQRILFLAILLCSPAFADTPPLKFIPWSPLDPDVKANLVERYSKQGRQTPAELEKSFSDVQRWHTFRDRDIVAAYPELRGGKKLSACTNSIMGHTTNIVFLSDAGNHVVTEKSLSCQDAGQENGVRCGTVTTTKKWFLETPTEAIELRGVSPQDAETIVRAYEANRVDELPEWARAYSFKLSAITAVPGRFRLIMGDVYCGGCYMRYEARLNTTSGEPRLVFVGNADGGCF